MTVRHLLSTMSMCLPVSEEANDTANGNLDCHSTNSTGEGFSYFHASSLEYCSKKKNLAEGKLVHAHMTQTGFKENAHLFLAAKLVIMYAKCGSLVDARRILDEMPKSKPNVVSWTAVIGGYARQGQSEEAFKLYCHLHRTGVPSDHFTFTTVIPACTDLASLEHGKAIHAHVIKNGFHSDYMVGSVLVDMYCKCGSINDAREVFDKMVERDVVTWNTIVAGYIRIGHVEEAMKLFGKIPEPNVVSWTTLIAGCAQNGLVDEALELFEIMPDRNVVSWTAMVAGFAQNGHCHEALKLFQQMQLNGVELDSGTFVSFLPVCADLKALGYGKAVHEKIIDLCSMRVLTKPWNSFIKCRSEMSFLGPQ